MSSSPLAASASSPMVPRAICRNVRPLEFQMFAGSVSVSHAYAHLFDFGGAVQVGGLQISPGDLIHGDVHGVQSIPAEIADQVPAVAAAIQRRRRHFTRLCRSQDFSLEKLRAAFQEPESSI